MGLFKAREPEQYFVLGNAIRCEVCEYDRFYQREGKINTTAMTLFDLDWLNASANCAVCAQCGYVHWFLPVN